VDTQPARAGAAAVLPKWSSRPPLWPVVTAVHGGVLGAWRHDLVRLVALTVYYLAIIMALIALYGGNEYVPPPFVYQGF
jgi:hypothetical protein